MARRHHGSASSSACCPWRATWPRSPSSATNGASPAARPAFSTASTPPAPWPAPPSSPHLTDRFRPTYILSSSAVLSGVGHLLFPLLADNVAAASPLRFMAGMGMIGVYVTGTRGRRRALRRPWARHRDRALRHELLPGLVGVAPAHRGAYPRAGLAQRLHPLGGARVPSPRRWPTSCFATTAARPRRRPAPALDLKVPAQ